MVGVTLIGIIMIIVGIVGFVIPEPMSTMTGIILILVGALLLTGPSLLMSLFSGEFGWTAVVIVVGLALLIFRGKRR